MQKNEVEIRELNTHLSRLLRRVQRGESLTVTDRGTPVARIVPAEVSSSEAMAALQGAGILKWSGEKFSPREPAATVKNHKSLSDLFYLRTGGESVSRRERARERVRHRGAWCARRGLGAP